MNKVAFEIGGFQIMWYAVLIMAGVILGLITVNYNVKRRKDLGVTFDDVTDAFLYAFPMAIIFARLYYVAFEWERYKGNLGEIINIRGGGLAIHGGILGAVIGVLIYKAVSKKSGRQILNMADAAAPGMILAQAVGRWGNFINQEAYGSEVNRKFIEHFPDFIQDGMFINKKFYHPTFLYESLWNLAVFAVLMYLFGKRKKNREGTVLAWYLILYSTGRFFIESLRTDSLWIGPIRTAQLASVIMFLAGLIYLIYRSRKKDEITDIISETPSPEIPGKVLEEEIKREERIHAETEIPHDMHIGEGDEIKKYEAEKEKISEIKEKRESEIPEETIVTEETTADIPVPAPSEEKRRAPKKGVVQSRGELVEPITENKVSLKDKIKASRAKSKERVITTEKRPEDNIVPEDETK